MFYLFIAIVVIIAAWLGYEIINAPMIKEEEDPTYDPTTSVWHDDDYHPNY